MVRDFKQLLQKAVKKILVVRHVAQLPNVDFTEENVMIHHH